LTTIGRGFDKLPAQIAARSERESRTCRLPFRTAWME
jgi:hypothetical protein